MSEDERKEKMRSKSARDALRRNGMDDSPTQSGIDEIDLITGKIRDIPTMSEKKKLGRRITVAWSSRSKRRGRDEQ